MSDEERALPPLVFKRITTEPSASPGFPWHARASVPGGWLVISYLDRANGTGGGITFMPDPNHTWQVDTYPK